MLNGRGFGFRSSAFSLYFILFFLFTYTPLFVLVIFSFNDSIVMAFPLKGFTLKWYQAFISNETAILAIVNTIYVATASACIATIAGLMAALALVRHRFPGRELYTHVIMIPMIIPGILLGISLLSLFSQSGVPLSLLTVMTGHALMGIPYATLVIMARLIGFDPALEEAAMDLGADEIGTFKEVTFPIIFPGILVAFMLAFTVSLEDVAVAFFTIGYSPTLPIYVYGMMRYARMMPILTAIAVSMVLASIVLSIVQDFTRKTR